MESALDLVPFSRNKYTNQYLNSAERLGLSVRQLNQSGLWVVSDGVKRLSIVGATVGCNNLFATRISANKYLTYLRLSRGGFRVPVFRRLDTGEYDTLREFENHVLEFAQELYPVVVKPTRGHGGKNVIAGIADESELREVAEGVWKQQLGEILVEQHIVGNHYRINLLDGNNINMAARYPAFVEGDGRSSVAALVETKNKRKTRSGDAPLVWSERMSRQLKLGGYQLDSVLNAGQRLQLVPESNLYLGGDVERMPVDVVSPGLVAYFQSVACYLGLRWLGLDLIVADVADSNAEKWCYINETSTSHPPHEHLPGETTEQHLAMSALILQKLFELPVTVQPWSLQSGLPFLPQT